MLILRFILSLSVGAIFFFFIIKPKMECGVKSTYTMVEKIFSEAKMLALKYNEVKVIFQDGKAIIDYGEGSRQYKKFAKISAPDVNVRACSNSTGTPSIKTTFKFSPKGLKDLSGTIYLKCGNDFIAFSVLSPTGGITKCILKNNFWETIEE